MTRTPNSRDRLKKVATTLYLEPEQADSLRQLSERTRVPQQAYMREGIALVLAKYAKRR
jgi:predicted DNA-binding protein